MSGALFIYSRFSAFAVVASVMSSRGSLETLLFGFVGRLKLVCCVHVAMMTFNEVEIFLMAALLLASFQATSWHASRVKSDRRKSRCRTWAWSPTAHTGRTFYSRICARDPAGRSASKTFLRWVPKEPSASISSSVSSQIKIYRRPISVNVYLHSKWYRVCGNFSPARSLGSFLSPREPKLMKLFRQWRKLLRHL